MWAPKNEIMDDYSIISMKKTFLQCNNSMNGVKPMKVSIFWFRKDLRLFDNKAFSKCIAETDEILPIYIIEDDCSDPAILSQPRMQFLLACLEKLRDQLDQYKSKLYLFRGNAQKIIKKICNEVDVGSLYFNRNYEPNEIKRDREIWEYCQATEIECKSYKDLLLHERGEILKKDKKPYIVFSFYFKKWIDLKKEPMEDIKHFKTANLTGLDNDLLPATKDAFKLKPEQALGEFLKWKVKDYDINRDYPFMEGTSRLSTYLRTGLVSIRQVYHAAETLFENANDKNITGIETFIKQLAWRDFYYQILYYFPYVENGPFNKKFNSLKWENDKRLFKHWCDGATGFPIVDAGMRQLNHEGWMHNRLRMITASFLIKDLLINWRWGEIYFKQKLIDYDLPLNNGGWQWCASTGTDAQPYFRMFNPYTQSKKFDPDGTFIKRYVPELKNVKGKDIHQPDKMSQKAQQESNCILGDDYPLPIVDHSKQRKKALERYKNV